MSKKKTELPEKKRGNGRLSKKKMYEMTASKAARAIQRLEELMNSTNENAALGAAKTILAKCLPDLKAEEFSGELKVELKNVLRLPNKRNLDTPSKTD